MSFQRTSEIVGGGQLFAPALLNFDGTSYLYSTSATTVGNKCTLVMRCAFTPTALTTWEWLFSMQGPTNHPRLYLATVSAGGSDEEGRIFLTADNNVGTIIGRIGSGVDLYNDGEMHSILAEVDGDAGTMRLVIDGIDWDDLGYASRIAPLAGTLDTGASSDLGVASTDTGGTKKPCDIGFVGYIDAAGLAWSDFFWPDGSPKEQDTTNWASTGFGAQPLFYNPHGDLRNNLGSGGNATGSGTIHISDKGNHPPHRGLATIGDITARDVRQGKVGWANAQRIAGSLDHNGLLLFHQFDGTASIPVSSLTPDFDYGGVGTFSESGSNNVYLDGTGYLVSDGGFIASFNPQGGWPSRAGKTRCYRVWGKVLSPVATSYFPTLQINYVDGSNFWSCRSMFNGNVYTQMYEWIAGAVGEGVRQSTTVFSDSGEYYFDMVVRDFGDTVSMTLTCVDESSKPSDLTVTQPQTTQLYKATRPNQATDKFVLGKWEVPSGWLNNLIRGIMVWDE